MNLYDGTYRITSPYGKRNLPNGDNRFHPGIDYVGISSKTIIAPTNGKIVSSQIITNKNSITWEWGNYIKMDDLNGYYLYFCHLNSRLVTKGQTVLKGQKIGVEGNTGYVIGNPGNHLHFEVRRIKDGVVIDPDEYAKILLQWYSDAVKKKYGFEDSTMTYLSLHPCPYDLFDKLLR